MRHLKEFNSLSELQTFYEGDSIAQPNVFSINGENFEYNDNELVCIYEKDDTDNSTLWTSFNDLTNLLEYVIIDGEKWNDVTSPAPASVLTEGKHIVKFKFKNYNTSAPFLYNKHIRHAHLPSDMTVLSDNFFLNCSNLQSVSLPESLTTISSAALSNCSSLRRLEIPKLVTSIGAGAISGLKLKELILNNSNWNISNDSSFESAIASTTTTEKIVFAEGFTYIPRMQNMGIKEIVIPSTIEVITSSQPFNGNNITKIDLSHTQITHINNGTFASFSTLTEIKLPKKLTFIGDAFDGCTSLGYVENGIRYLNDENLGLVPINVEDSLTSYSIKNGVKRIYGNLFNNESTVEIELPNSLEYIGDTAFNGCTALENIIIPNSVKHIGDNAFKNCTSIKSITIPNSLESIGSTPLYGTALESLVINSNLVTNIMNLTAGDARTTLKNIIIGTDALDSTGHMQSSLFSGLGALEYVTFPEGLVEIPSLAGCYSLKELIAPSTVLSINNMGGCSALTKVDLSTTSMTSFGPNAGFGGCSSLEDVRLPNTLTEIGNLDSTHGIFASTGLTSITLPNSITTIGNYAFTGCGKLESINIPTSLTSLGKNAFAGTKLGYVEDGVTYFDINETIGSIAINYDYSNLTSLTIKNTVKSFDNIYFNFNSLTSLTLLGSFTSIPQNQFKEHVKLQTINLPNTVTTIYDKAFMNCVSLENINIDNNIISIGNNSFKSCKSLSNTARTNILAINQYCEIDKYIYGEYMYANSEGYKIVTDEVKDQYSEWTPIGFCITSTGFFGPNEKARFMSLKYMSRSNPDSGVSYVDSTNGVMSYGNKFVDISTLNNLQTQSLTGANTFYSGASNHLPSIFGENGYNYEQLGEAGQYALTDIDGKGNTTKLLATVTGQPNWQTDSTIVNEYAEGYASAACCCARYHTLGTQAGDWYLGALGEYSKIIQDGNSTDFSNRLKTIYNKFGSITMNGVTSSNYLWTSTEYNDEKAYRYKTRYSDSEQIQAYSKGGNGYVIALLQY